MKKLSEKNKTNITEEQDPSIVASKKQESQYSGNHSLEIEGLTKLFPGNQGIRDVNLVVDKGSFHVIIGHNGAGKTTLIKSILGIHKQYSGSIIINGVNCKENKSKIDTVSYIGEKTIFPWLMSAGKYLEWAGYLANKNIGSVKNKIQLLAANFGVSHILKKNPNKMSSGQKQKILLIRVLIEDKSIIVMDEPTANLDPSARIVFFREIKKLNKEGKTIIICSHNLDEIEAYAETVSIIKNGELAYHGKKKKKLMEMFKKFGHIEIQEK